MRVYSFLHQRTRWAISFGSHTRCVMFRLISIGNTSATRSWSYPGAEQSYWLMWSAARLRVWETSSNTTARWVFSSSIPRQPGWWPTLCTPSEWTRSSLWDPVLTRRTDPNVTGFTESRNFTNYPDYQSRPILYSTIRKKVACLSAGFEWVISYRIWGQQSMSLDRPWRHGDRKTFHKNGHGAALSNGYPEGVSRRSVSLDWVDRHILFTSPAKHPRCLQRS